MLPEIIDRRLRALIDLDLLHARIALDVENRVTLAQIIIELLGAADVENGVRLDVELLNLGQAQARRRFLREITRAEGPAMLEPKFVGELSENLGGI